MLNSAKLNATSNVKSISIVQITIFTFDRIENITEKIENLFPSIFTFP